MTGPARNLMTVDAVAEWFDRGRRPISGSPLSGDGEGEPVSLFQHGLQCAELLSGWFPDDLELHVAGLLHDLGHHFAIGGEVASDHDLMHGIDGADAVRGLFGARVARLIALHVPAKRYLSTFEPTYADVLSPVSTHTMARQGGPMDDDDKAAYESLPDWTSAVHLRRADDLAKVPGTPTRPLSAWVEVMSTLAGQVTADTRLIERRPGYDLRRGHRTGLLQYPTPPQHPSPARFPTQPGEVPR